LDTFEISLKKWPLRAGLPVPGGLDGLDQTQAITKLTGSEIEAFRTNYCIANILPKMSHNTDASIQCSRKLIFSATTNMTL
jgi:hypothetical protein